MLRPLTRRRAVALLAAIPFSRWPASSSQTEHGVERHALDPGYYGARGGPVAALRDGSLVRVTTEPEAPYTSEAMWPISRLTLRRSTDDGRSWVQPVEFVRGAKEYSVLSHALFETRQGTLLHVFVRYSGYDYATGSPEKSLCEVFYHRSGDGGRTWSEPRKMPTGERYNGDILSLAQLRDGRLIYPCAFLTPNQAQFAVSALYSDDDGLTWTRSRSVLRTGGGGFESGASEPTAVELPDGRLWMLIRAQTGFLWESLSNDRGATWSPAQPSRLPSSNAPATMLKLRNGRIAVAWNNHVQGNYSRQSLAVGITSDGHAFSGLRQIDGTDFPDNPAEPAAHVTYPYLTETNTGTIIVSYNKGHWMRHNRPALARITPGWITARDERVDFRNGRMNWHSVNPGPKRLAAVERYVRPANSDELWLEIEQQKDVVEPAGITHSICLVDNGEIEAVVQAVRPDGYLLFADSLLPPGNIDEACLRIHFGPGRVSLAAGSPREVRRDRRSTVYSYLAHLVENESPYPAPGAADGIMHIRIRYAAAKSEAVVNINDGPAAALKTGPILGLSFFSVAVHRGGLLRVRSIHARRA